MDRCLQDWRHHGISGHPLRTFWLYHPKRHPSGVAFLVSSLKTITAKNYIWGKEKCWKTIRYLSLLAACVVRRRAPLATPSTADREHLLPCCEQPTQRFVVAPCRAVKTLQRRTQFPVLVVCYVLKVSDRLFFTRTLLDFDFCGSSCVLNGTNFEERVLQRETVTRRNRTREDANCVRVVHPLHVETLRSLKKSRDTR